MIIGIRTSATFFAFILLFIANSPSFAEKQNRAKTLCCIWFFGYYWGKSWMCCFDLDVDEQSELKDYQASLDEFKTKQRQKQVSGGNQQTKKPEPPKKPSFCSDKATTQYIFDGCSVQGDNIYIGDTFVRKLTADEQHELEQFDAKFSTYQKAATADFRKKVQSAFGEHFGSLFGGFIGGGGSEDEKENDNSGGSSLANLEAPKAPNLCTLII
uniref:Pepsin inhibitor-3-like repeated domain-containing protein n=1 Tax=Meloidogyne incognita TaxID=6306 RepID=A0A914M764_MELIC